MSIKIRLHAARRKIINLAGAPIRIQRFTSTIGSVYDDDISWSQAGGDLWTSGIFFPLNTGKNSSDSILVEQGKLIHDDKKLFVHGSILFTGSEETVSIRIGSPGNNSDNQFSLLAFSQKYEVQNEAIYKQVYIRLIGGTGSLLGV
ncbi:MAG: hypothetical protein IIA87_03675 [Nanoarchaeota archaeon]|nr:hypothetical protein [Nanoarchaeota archaeon]